jgi:hypothetical protein
MNILPSIQQLFCIGIILLALNSPMLLKAKTPDSMRLVVNDSTSLSAVTDSTISPIKNWYWGYVGPSFVDRGGGTLGGIAAAIGPLFLTAGFNVNGSGSHFDSFSTRTFSGAVGLIARANWCYAAIGAGLSSIEQLHSSFNTNYLSPYNEAAAYFSLQGSLGVKFNIESVGIGIGSILSLPTGSQGTRPGYVGLFLNVGYMP